MTIPATVFDPPFRVTRASHLVLRVRDLAASRAFYVDTLGMIVSDEGPGALYLRGIEEACHHSLVLEASLEPACERVGMRVQTEDDLDRLQAYFAAQDLPTRWADAPFQNRTLHTRDPVGTPLEFCASMQTKPRCILDFELYRGACPHRIDHFQILTPEVGRACAFYMAMGFRLSEYVMRDDAEAMAMAFLQRKGNPHDIVFANNQGPRLHHAAFTVPEAHHLLGICDLLGRNGFGRSVERGPGRHYGPGFARYVYLRDPDGHRIELFTNHYQTLDAEDEPVRWQMSELNKTGAWGPPPPASWLNEASAFASA